MIHTDATPGSGTEWHVRVVMTASWSFGQEVIGVEHFGVGEHVLITVNFECGDDDRGTNGQGNVSWG